MLELYRHWGIEDAQSMEMIQRRYIERLIGCVENVASPACRDALGARIGKIRAMLTTHRAREALRVAQPRSFMMKLMLIPVRLPSPCLCFAEGWCIDSVKRRSAGTFARLKAGR